ncbi:MAG: TSUP family transporter [Xanthomonadales bacterium]|nr:TSUP family transporter [Xanthomonadales bacterium]
MPLLILAGLFFLVAVAYSSVGFGGGSTYNALLILSGMDYRLVPAIALSCNILVVSGGVYHYWRAGFLSMGRLLPFILLSVPMAWLGGSLAVSEQLFIGLLGFSLLVAAAQMLVKPHVNAALYGYGTSRYWITAASVGGLIGLLAGITGIGGGIYLAPVIYFLRLAPARTVAGITSGFILVNSFAGLAGQMMKAGEYSPVEGWLQAWPLFIAVVIGGQIGSHLGVYKLPEAWIKRLTAVLMLYVAVRLIWRWVGMSI